jgi:hypothetical protein
MSPDSITQASRITRLERQAQRAQALACGGALVAATLLLTGYHGETGEVVRAERFELVTLLDGKGRPTGVLRLSDEPRVAVQTGRGREVAGLGYPQVHNLTE